MGDIELISYRVQQNEKDNIQLKSDILEIKQTLSRMEQRLAIIPEKGFDCPLHLLRMNQYEKRLETIETKMESVHTKIISWSAVAAVILFIVSSFGVPYIKEHMNEAPHTYTEPTKTTWNGFPMPSPMPFSYSSNIFDLVKK